MTRSVANMDTARRQILFGTASAALLPMSMPAHGQKDVYPNLVNPSTPYSYDYVDYWSEKEIRRRNFKNHTFGTKPALDKDIAKAELIIAAAPKDSPLSIMKYFSELTEVGSTNERFNARWQQYENPVIVWFFHATKLKPDGDCTSWCAAFVSWSLERAGIKSKHSASSQAYANFGTLATNPKPGDVVVFQNSKDPGHGHVALFLEQTADEIRIIGGNRGNAGSIPSCPAGYPISSIGEDWRDKVNGVQNLLTIRAYA